MDRADALVERIKTLAGRTHGPAVLEGIGGFASLFSLKPILEAAGGMADPVLVAGTDGVGTKLKLAFRSGRHDTIGVDLVAMCLNDILTTGATPLFFLDYFGTGKLDVGVAESVIAGIAAACKEGGLALVGGETAELPGLYAPGEYDLAGFAVGVVDREKIIDGKSCAAGDVLLGVRSTGLHSNGFSLAQKILFEHAGLTLDSELEDCGTVLEALMPPTALYTKAVKALSPLGPKALAHITGGGLPGNLPRVLPESLTPVVRKGWGVPSIFLHLQRLGNVEEAEMYRTFNMGIGLVVVLAPENVAAAVRALAAVDQNAVVIGELVPRTEPQEDFRWAP